jgi:hypothetical protein
MGPLVDSSRHRCMEEDPSERTVGPEHRVACHFAGPAADLGNGLTAPSRFDGA